MSNQKTMDNTLEELLNKIRSLGNDDYRDLMIRAFDHSRPAAIQKFIVQAIKKKGSRNCSRMGRSDKEDSGVDAQGTVMSWPSLPFESSRAAWDVPFIYRGDLVPERGHVFFDVEKVSLKTSTDTHDQVGCVVAVVNEQKELILWSFIKPEREVCQYFKSITGVDKTKLELGLPMQTVSFFVDLCFQGNTVVGYDMDSDLKSVGSTNVTIKDDLSDYFYESRLAPNSRKEIKEKYSVKDLNVHFFHTDIQCSVHSAIIDARKTRDLWMKKNELIINQPIFTENVARSGKKQFTFDQTDVCTCPNTKANQRRNNRPYFPS